LTIRWGIVGLGRIASDRIAPAILALEQCELVGVAGRDQNSAAAFARRFGAQRAYVGIEALLTDPNLDAVYVATPNALHPEQVRQVAAAGKHVLCEKPLALSAVAAAAAVEDCRAAGVVLGVMFQTRYHDGFADLARVVREGGLGPVVVAELEIGAAYTLPTGWRGDPQLAGLGTLNNQGVHGIDLLRFLLDDEVVEVVAMVDDEPLDLVATVLVRFSRGTIAYLHSSHCLPHPRNDLVLRGANGYAIARDMTRADRDGRITVCRGDDPPVTVAASSRGAHQKAIEAFSDAVQRGREPSPNGSDGLRAAEVMDAVSRSIRGRRVELVTAAASPA
jgi:1,5-anhydro-D-fructose reductase (1,5-anhydro-D-mannitol-forming)